MEKWQILKYTTVIFLAISVIVLILLGWTEDSLRLSIRASARIAAVFFCLAFGAAPLYYFIKNEATAYLLANRRYLGVTFAVIHLIHLFTLLLLQLAFHPVFEKAAAISLIGGGLAYFFALGMLVTSFDKFKYKLKGKSWLIFHTIGGFWIWFIFIRTYGKAMTRGEFTLLPILILLILVFLLRLLRYFSTYREKKYQYT